MSGSARVLRLGELRSVERGGGARTTPMVSAGIGSTSILNGITAFAPGASIPMHTHDCEESVLVLEGDCIAVMDGVEHRLGPRDATFIPAGVPHRFINASETLPAAIFWTYASVEATRTMIATGETHPVQAEHEGRKQADDDRSAAADTPMVGKE
jgi:quercetin dioxygenase-like cupin family protein